MQIVEEQRNARAEKKKKKTILKPTKYERVNSHLFEAHGDLKSKAKPQLLRRRQTIQNK